MNELEDGLAISVRGLSKKFGLSLKQSMRYGLIDNSKRLIGIQPKTNLLRPGEFWALENISFVLKKGEALGIMGVNGCGKTTLLRILNGVFSPDEGEAVIRGRVGAMIAAGAGFAPTLSGRENIHINGALLGMSPYEIDSVIDEIIDFSEIGQFIDMPVKNYSSGMTIRLGFAISVFSRPDVLLMDEILAVGDINFQKKCFNYILNLKKSGTSVILVSHSQGAIWSVCDRGIFLNEGKILLDGSVEDLVRAYDDQNAIEASKSSVKLSTENLPSDYGHSKGGSGELKDVTIRLIQVGLDVKENQIGFGDSFEINVNFTLSETQNDLLLRFTIDAAHYPYIASIDTLEQGLELKTLEAGRYCLTAILKNPNFRPGSYKINFSANVRHSGVHLFYWFGASTFVIKHPKDRFLYSEPNAVMHLDSECKIELV